MNLLDRIKLIIEARSFYVKKVYIHDGQFCVLDSIPGARWDLKSVTDWLKESYDSKTKRVLGYKRDNFRWVVWYI